MKARIEDYEDEMEGMLLLPCQRNLNRIDDDEDCRFVTCQCRKYPDVYFSDSIYLTDKVIDEVCREKCPAGLR